MNVRGIFVSIDGPGGAGKSATAALAREQLTARGLRVHATAEPSRTPLGEMIRASTDTYRKMALACLVAGDRHHHLATEILPLLQAGVTVICDRYVPSSLVLQRMDGVDWDTIWQLNNGAEPPDLAHHPERGPSSPHQPADQARRHAQPIRAPARRSRIRICSVPRHRPQAHRPRPARPQH